MRVTGQGERGGGVGADGLLSRSADLERPAIERAPDPATAATTSIEAAALGLVRDLVANRDPKALAQLLGAPSASSAELQAVLAAKGSSRVLAERVLAAVESVVRSEVERAEPAAPRPTPNAKAERNLAQIATSTIDDLHRHVRTRAKTLGAFEPAPSIDAATHRHLRRAVDRQLRATLQLPPDARKRVIDDAALAIQSTIAASLAERGLAGAPKEVRQGGFFSGLKAVVERASNQLSKLAHGLHGVVKRPAPKEVSGEKATIGERIADAVAAFGGSWKFIISAVAVMGAWVTANTVLGMHFDPYPFILLNLCLSVIAALQGPVILMSANRQSARDRKEADETHEASIRTEEELLALRAEHAELKGMVQELLEAQRSRTGADKQST